MEESFEVFGKSYIYEEVAKKLLRYHKSRKNNNYQCEPSISRYILMLKSELSVCEYLRKEGKTGIIAMGLYEAIHTATNQNRKGLNNSDPDVSYLNQNGDRVKVEVKSRQSSKYFHKQVLVNTAKFYRKNKVDFIAFVNFPRGENYKPEEPEFFCIRDIMEQEIKENVFGEDCFDLEDLKPVN